MVPLCMEFGKKTDRNINYEGLQNREELGIKAKGRILSSLNLFPLINCPFFNLKGLRYKLKVVIFF